MLDQQQWLDASKEQESCGSILQALAECDHYPEASREMLISGLPYAWAVCDGERHRIQVQVLCVIRGVLSDARLKVTDAEAARQARIIEEQQSIRACEREQSRARALEESLKPEREATVAALRRCGEELQFAKKEEGDAGRAKDSLDLEISQLRDLRRRTGVCSAIATGSWESESARNADIRLALEGLRQIPVGEALVVAAERALTVQASERGPFDNKALQRTISALEGAAADAEKKLTIALHEVDYAAARALGAWAMVDVAQRREREAQSVLASLDGRIEAAAAASAAAEQTARAKARMVRELTSDQAISAERARKLDLALNTLDGLVAGEAGEGGCVD